VFSWQGLINSVLLPVVVISFVMLILKLNIDPAGPELMLNFRMYAPTSNKDSPLKTIVPVVVGAPHSDDALSLLHGNEYLEYYAQDIGLKNSVQLSEQLLETYSLKPARFGKHQFSQVKSKIFDSVFPLDPHVITIALIGLEIFEFVFLFDPCIAKL
jgi:hypothetical protein